MRRGWGGPCRAIDSARSSSTTRRGSAVVEYAVESVTVREGVLRLRYTSTSKLSDSATSACALIVSVAKGQYRAIEFIEGGKLVKTIDLHGTP